MPDIECVAPEALRRFVWDIQSMVELEASMREILLIGGDLMARLVAHDDWLPAPFAGSDPQGPRQVQLYADGLQRFSVVATILAGGQALPAYQDPVWEIMGLLRGGALRRRFAVRPQATLQAKDAGRRLEPGMVDSAAPDPALAVQLANAFPDRTSIAIHAYGGEIGALARRAFTPAGAEDRITGYADAPAPPYDIWSIQARIAD